MKIKDILTPEELKECQLWGLVYNAEKIEGRLVNHFPEMEISEYCLYRIAEILEDIEYREVEE